MPTLRDALAYEPHELSFGTSGLRGLASVMTDLECYINVSGFLQFLQRSEKQGQGSTIYIAGDLRDSTPRILRAVHQAVLDSGHQTQYCGLIPTPTLANYALHHHAPCIMVTGSHIPAERNGIKFYKASGEVLKADESPIGVCVTRIRTKQYNEALETSLFTSQGSLKDQPGLSIVDTGAAELYLKRYQSVFAGDTLAGKKLVFYQHSGVGRDLLAELLTSLGASVTTVGRSDTFVPIDSENVTPENRAYFRELAKEYPDAFAILSTDGDGDRPFLVDETGTFHRGDVLGAIVATWLSADFAAYTASTNDAVDAVLDTHQIDWKRTRIGSPYVIHAMHEALDAGKQRVVSWEVNGGFLTGSDFTVRGMTLPALPTRDAIFPILCALYDTIEKGQTVSERFAALPQRFTQAGLINDFAATISKAMIHRFSVDLPGARAELKQYFVTEKGFDGITGIEILDGPRIFFANGDIAHIRPSSNAPQLRIYATANTQARADEIVRLAIEEPDGIFRQIERDITV